MKKPQMLRSRKSNRSFSAAQYVLAALLFASLLACDRGERPADVAASPAPAPTPAAETGPRPPCDALKGREVTYGYGLTRSRSGDAPERVGRVEVRVDLDGSEVFNLNVQVPEQAGYSGSSAVHANYPDVTAELGIRVDEQGAIHDEFSLKACGQTVEQFSVMSKIQSRGEQ